MRCESQAAKERMTAKGLEASVVIELDCDPQSEGWKLDEVEGGLQGYRMAEAVDRWFSCALDVECFALHSPLDRIKPTKPAKAICTKEGD